MRAGLGTLIIILVFLQACKKPPVDSKVFVERHLEGLWRLNATVYIDKKNNDTLRNDTISLANDTTAFTKDLYFLHHNLVQAFQVDEMGASIRFVAMPDSVWSIDYLRKTNFRLVHTRKDTLMGNTYQYEISRVFTKLSY